MTRLREQVIEFFFEGKHGNRPTKGYQANSEHAADAILTALAPHLLPQGCVAVCSGCGQAPRADKACHYATSPNVRVTCPQESK